MWKTILTFLQTLPEIIKIVRHLVDMVQDLIDTREKKKRLEELDAALTKAEKEKDTSDLEKFFGRRGVDIPDGAGKL